MFNGGRFLTDGCGVFVGLPQTEYPSIHELIILIKNQAFNLLKKCGIKLLSLIFKVFFK